MRDKINPRSIIVVAGLLLEGWALYVVGVSAAALAAFPDRQG